MNSERWNPCAEQLNKLLVFYSSKFSIHWTPTWLHCTQDIRLNLIRLESVVCMFIIIPIGKSKSNGLCRRMPIKNWIKYCNHKILSLIIIFHMGDTNRCIACTKHWIQPLLLYNFTNWNREIINVVQICNCRAF